MAEKMIRNLGWLFIAIGILLLAGAVVSINSTRQLLSQGIRTTGNVVDYSISQDSEGTLMYAPVFKFLDQAGFEHQVQSNVSSSSPAYIKGQAVTIIYRSVSPENAEIMSAFGMWGLASILGFIGLIFVVFGIGAGFVVRKVLESHGPEVEFQFSSGDTDDDINGV